MFTIEIEDGLNKRYKNNINNNTRKRINILKVGNGRKWCGKGI